MTPAIRYELLRKLITRAMNGARLEALRTDCGLTPAEVEYLHAAVRREGYYADPTPADLQYDRDEEVGLDRWRGLDD